MKNDEMDLDLLKSEANLKKVQISSETQATLDAIIQQQYQAVTFRRICWPTPDRLCLTGGCGYCNDAPFRSLGKIKHFIRHAPADWRDRLWDAYEAGKDNNFDMAQVWRGDWPSGVSRK